LGSDNLTFWLFSVWINTRGNNFVANMALGLGVKI